MILSSILVVGEGPDGCWELSWELRMAAWGAVGVPKKCEKITKNQFFQKVVFRLEMYINVYLVMF